MKTLGLIGGMSWESTAEYYALINRGVNAALGKNHSAKIVMESFDFQRIEELQYAGDWVALERESGSRPPGPTWWCCAPIPCTRWSGTSKPRRACP